jgi:hypothetical protein
MLGHHVFSFEVRFVERYILGMFFATLKKLGEQTFTSALLPPAGSFSATHCKYFVKKRIFIYQFVDNNYQYHYHSHQAEMGWDTQ